MTSLITYHENTDRFRAALQFTEAETCLTALLVEKDYYCSLILNDFRNLFDQGLIFKGGTCLSKVYADFYRLSEDLDFAISVEAGSPPSIRRAKIDPVKSVFARLPERYSCIAVSEPLSGHRSSTQYIGQYSYQSLLSGQKEHIKVEVSLREPILEPIETRPANTSLLCPLKKSRAIAPFPIAVMTLRETYSEKLRAALTRMDPAIRDFFDIDYAITKGIIRPFDSQLIAMLRRKLAIPGNSAVDISDAKMLILQKQLETRLKSVLRLSDYTRFDLPRAFDAVQKVAETL